MTSVAFAPEAQSLTSTLALVYRELELLLTKFRGGEKDEEGRRWIWKSNRELHQRLKEQFPYLKISIATVGRALARLAQLGFIRREQRKRHRLWHVYFYALPEWHPQADAANEMPCGTDAATDAAHTSSTSKSSYRRKRPIGFGQSKQPTALTEVNAVATRPANKPEGKILVNGVWCVDDQLWPNYG